MVPPPGNEARLAHAQDWCFATYGHPSSRALPAIIPLFWQVHDLPAPGHRQARMPVDRVPHASHLRLDGGTLSLALDEDATWTSLREQLHGVFPDSDARELFPPAPGFFLCDGVRKIATPQPPCTREPIRFHRLDLAALAIWFADPGEWWTQIQWELLWRVRCLSDRAAGEPG